MQVEAIYDRGSLTFVEPLKLKHDHLRLVVTVPDDEIDTMHNPYDLPPEVLERAQAMLKKFDAIRNAPLPPDDDLPELSPEYEDRIAAIELHAQKRQEQGRPA